MKIILEGTPEELAELALNIDRGCGILPANTVIGKRIKQLPKAEGEESPKAIFEQILHNSLKDTLRKQENGEI